MATPPSTQHYPQLHVKLDGNNYYKWPISINMLFDSLDLNYINGIPPPSATFGEKNVVV